jgi:transcriptional regulator with XRE-family HTH domain
MAKSLEHNRALVLRKKGWSIIKIAENLGVSKSSVSGWCRDVILTKKQKDRLISNSIKGGHKGRIIGANMNKQKRLDSLAFYEAEGREMLSRISSRELLVAGICLYWAEGAKTGGRFIFVNSDPDMILLIHRFMKESLNIRKEDIKITIQINHIHEHRIRQVILFWSKLLNLPLSSFSKPYYVHVIPKKVYSNYNEYYGIVRLRVLKSANLQYKVLGLIKALSQHKMPV